MGLALEALEGRRRQGALVGPGAKQDMVCHYVGWGEFVVERLPSRVVCGWKLSSVVAWRAWGFGTLQKHILTLTHCLGVWGHQYLPAHASVSPAVKWIYWFHFTVMKYPRR